MTNARELACSCGARYRNLRTGLDYATVRRMMDPKRWRYRRRRSVLGYWHEMKVKMWTHEHRGCE